MSTLEHLITDDRPLSPLSLQQGGGLTVLQSPAIRGPNIPSAEFQTSSNWAANVSNMKVQQLDEKPTSNQSESGFQSNLSIETNEPNEFNKKFISSNSVESKLSSGLVVVSPKKSIRGKFYIY